MGKAAGNSSRKTVTTVTSRSAGNYRSNIFGSNNQSSYARSSNERAAMLNAGMLALPLKSTEAKKVDWAAALSRYVARAYSKEHAAAHSEQFATVAA